MNEEKGGGRERERESKILGPLFCHGIRMEASEERYIEIVFVKEEGRFVDVLGRKLRNDASDESKLVKGGLKNDLSLHFNGFIV